MQAGFVEILSTQFVSGWASDSELDPMLPVVVAKLGDEILGWSVCRFARRDLPAGAAFVIPYCRNVAAEQVSEVEVFQLRTMIPLARGRAARIEAISPLQVFVVGSPRSGTSQLGKCISEVFALPWFGEGHGAPALGGAWNAIPDNLPANSFASIMGKLDLSAQILLLAREGYYFAHSSGSFRDKTPGVAMVRSIPMLRAAFPNSRIIFAKRNGIANVLSRMTKFGGKFEAHCNDWSAAMQAWAEVKNSVPDALEIDQEEMLSRPSEIAASITRYLGKPDAADDLHAALTTHSMERTGAGIGRNRLGDTGWTPEEIAAFTQRCGPMMRAFGYPMS